MADRSFCLNICKQKLTGVRNREAFSNTMSSSIELSRSVYDITSSSEPTDTSSIFKVRLYHDYKQTTWLLNLPMVNQHAEWITVTTPHGRTYKMKMLIDGGSMLLQRGWNLLTTVENLREGYKLMFQTETDSKLSMWIYKPADHAPAIGFTPERIPPALKGRQIHQVIVNKGAHRSAVVNKAIKKIWNSSSIDGPVYVCRLLISPSAGKFLIFNKKYSRLIPKEKGTVAMRFIGSDIILPGAIKTYKDGCARMVKEWPVYAIEHNLTLGEIFVCKIQRGPAAWEFIGCCAGR